MRYQYNFYWIPDRPIPAEVYVSVEAALGGQIGSYRFGAGTGYSQQEDDGLHVKTVRYFTELMYVMRNGLYSGVRYNQYNDELSGDVEGSETIMEADAVVGFLKGIGYAEASASKTEARISAGFVANF